MLAVLATACSDTSGPGDNSQAAVGVYVLTSLNNIPMPVPLGEFFGYTLEYTSSRMSLNPDSSFSERSIITERANGVVALIDTVIAVGRWRLTGARMVLRDAAATDSIVGQLSNGTLTFDIKIQPADSTYHYVYKKQ